MELALLVVAPLSEDGREVAHARVARRALAARYVVETIDLVAEGVTPAMSRSERIHYESPDPILDPAITAYAELVGRAAIMTFVFPTRWWSPPPILKAWMERVLVPGVAFVLDDRHRVRPNLRNLRAIVGVTTREHPEAIADGGDGARRMLLRTMRLNVPRRVRTEWLVEPDEPTIATRIGRL